MVLLHYHNPGNCIEKQFIDRNTCEAQQASVDVFLESDVQTTSSSLEATTAVFGKRNEYVYNFVLFTIVHSLIK